MTQPHVTLHRTPLYTKHVELGARLVPFAGWEMPLQYTSILDEHHVVRTNAGLFDVSHMLRADVRGPAAAEALRSAVTYNVRALAPGRAHYALLCELDGGIRDDAFVYRIEQERFLFVGNASNAEPDLSRLRECMRSGAELTSLHETTAMLALQGPASAGIIGPLSEPPVADLRGRACITTHVAGRSALVARTGYTGEDGFEIVVAAEDAEHVWSALTSSGARPCGLGARDSLRLEAALVLYGNDIDVTTNPFEAGLAWVVSLDDDMDFAGRAALERLRLEEPSRRLVCIRAEGRGIMRHGHSVLSPADGEAIGTVTSGGFSPTLEVSIGMGYVRSAEAQPGTPVTIDVRGKPLPARIVERPFYRRGRQA